ncbi:MAG: PilZ domain-containing protein, partial [Desulfobacterales bacterium]|nr:PilZ domain-containing protein [Desulfobacterales bacterium]
AQKHALPPTTGKTAPASSTKSTDTARLLLSISPLVLAIIALLVAARAFRAARTQGRKMEVPAALSPGNEPAALSPENDTTAEKPRISPEKPPVNEKRRATRLNRLIEVDFSVDGRFFRGFINNLSETGAYVDTPEQLAVGREITIACPDIHTGGHIKRAGLIVRLTPTGIGVHFQKTEIS